MGLKTSRQTLAKKVSRAIDRRQFAKAWSLLDKDMERVLSSKHLTWVWLKLMDADPESEPDRGALETALVRWEDEPRLVLPLCEALLDQVDGRYTEEPVAEDDPALVVLPYLSGALEALGVRQLQNPNEGGQLWDALARAYRLAGPEYDDEAIEAHSQALAAENRASWRFNLGLFFKNRRRWEDGVRVFRELFEEDPSEQPVFWNLGICATALGDAELACEAWQAGGIPATVGEDGRPKVPRLGRVKVRIPGRPEDDPSVVAFEHVWVEPVSPCHGRVLNPTFYVNDVEMNDLVLWDGQPIGYAFEGSKQVPRFAMLARLAPSGWRSFRFRAEQASGGQLDALGEGLPRECSLYVFEEEVGFFCAECIRTGRAHSKEHEKSVREATSVHGKVLVCPETPLEELRRELEEAIARAEVPGFAVPDLYEALGDGAAVEAHRERWDEL